MWDANLVWDAASWSHSNWAVTKTKTHQNHQNPLLLVLLSSFIGIYRDYDKPSASLWTNQPDEMEKKGLWTLLASRWLPLMHVASRSFGRGVWRCWHRSPMCRVWNCEVWDFRICFVGGCCTSWELTYLLPKALFENGFPFTEVGYVSSLLTTDLWFFQVGLPDILEDWRGIFPYVMEHNLTGRAMCSVSLCKKLTGPCQLFIRVFSNIPAWGGQSSTELQGILNPKPGRQSCYRSQRMRTWIHVTMLPSAAAPGHGRFI